MVTNADQRMWRQIRISTDQRKWRQIRITVDQWKWRQIRISAASFWWILWPSPAGCRAVPPGPSVRGEADGRVSAAAVFCARVGASRQPLRRAGGRAAQSRRGRQPGNRAQLQRLAGEPAGKGPHLQDCSPGLSRVHFLYVTRLTRPFSYLLKRDQCQSSCTPSSTVIERLERAKGTAARPCSAPVSRAVAHLARSSLSITKRKERDSVQSSR